MFLPTYLIARTRPHRPTRILLVEPNLSDNGAIRVSLDRAGRWAASGAQVELFVVEHGEDDVPVPPGVTVRRATRRPVRLRWTLALGLVRLHGRARRSDVVVAGREINSGLLLTAVAARSARRPFAVTVQSRPDTALRHYVGERLRGPTRRALVSAHLAVTVAADLVPTLLELGLPASRARVVTNGVDVDGVRAAGRRPPEVALPDQPWVVGCGRLARQKGFDLLVRAHARALADGAPGHVLVLLGDGPDRAELEHLAVELGVQDSVVLAGFVENPHAVVARAALFVLPSRWEGFPLALVEAQCVGTPSLAADCVAGPREVLADGRYGELVPAEDVTALAAAMTAHLRDPSTLEAKARAGRDAAAGRFDADTAAQAHLDLLHQLILAER